MIRSFRARTRSFIFASLLFRILTLLCASALCDSHAQTDTNPPVTTLKPVTVWGQGSSLHDVASETERVGPANQPEWTTRRAFAETDIYVIPPGEMEFNQFYISSHPRHGKPENLFESEFEFGLPWRTQFDVELNYSLDSGRLKYDSTLLELPHALADWGKIPLNPTINFGWRFNADKADAYLLRLLLAEELGHRIHFGANLTFDREIGDGRQTAYELNAALSYVTLESRLTLGLEMLAEYETENEEEGTTHSTTVMLGPTALYKPTRNTHLGLVPLLGLTHDAPVVEVFLIFGLDLEPLLWGKSGDSPAADADQFRPVRRRR